MRFWCPLLRKCMPHAHRMPPESKAKRLVERMFGKYLLLTNTVSSGLLMVAGDFIAQHIERKRLPAAESAELLAEESPKVNLVRIGEMFLVGSVQGPVQHFFYAWLDRRFVAITPITVAKKIFLDQTIMSPICIATFFATASMVERQSWIQFVDEISSKFMTVYISDWLIWPFAQYINFTFVPPVYRVMYVNCLTLLYNVWLSIVKHNDVSQQIQRLFGEVVEESLITDPTHTNSHLPSASNDKPRDNQPPK